MLAASVVGPQGLVFAIEPLPKTAAALEDNLRQSNYSNVRVICSALSDKNDSIEVHTFRNDPSQIQASVGKPENIFVDNIHVVQAIKVEDLAAGLDGLALLKLDVEGSELPALRGCHGLLAERNSPMITFEWNEETARSLGYKPSEILEYLSRFSYRFYLAGKEGLHEFEERADTHDWSPMVWALKPDTWHVDRLKGQRGNPWRTR